MSDAAAALVSLVLAVVAIVFAVMLLRATRRMRHEGDQEWRERWRALDPEHRKRILATMRRGEAIEDPEDADLGVRAVRQLDFVSRQIRPVEIMFLPLFALMILLGVGNGESALLIGAGLAFLLAAPLRVIQASRRKTLHRSVAATRALHEP